MKQVYAAGIIVYRVTEMGNVYLLIRYSHAGHWDFPKGKIEEGETDQQAASRELYEETGIADVQLDATFFEHIEYEFMMFDGSLAHKQVNYFLGRTHQEHVRLSDEHNSFIWLGYEAAYTRLTHVSAKKLLEKAQGHTAQ
ncbi:MAG TPA: NUDIX domain-containing protein [Candidatus Babeliales bacterium]|jgi:mutator protein MutT|nr:NUDIX domain-containing protein [Candidatus Babeliales bacterium]